MSHTRSFEFVTLAFQEDFQKLDVHITYQIMFFLIKRY